MIFRPKYNFQVQIQIQIYLGKQKMANTNIFGLKNLANTNMNINLLDEYKYKKIGFTKNGRI